mmetsp:Transcript_7935/g.12637  ORF Transcript_7935/g.12637 Transcript_7935/m.12637 type:complete len:232 (+) Transcript_7935:46-741(+)
MNALLQWQNGELKHLNLQVEVCSARWTECIIAHKVHTTRQRDFSSSLPLCELLSADLLCNFSLILFEACVYQAVGGTMLSIFPQRSNDGQRDVMHVTACVMLLCQTMQHCAHDEHIMHVDACVYNFRSSASFPNVSPTSASTFRSGMFSRSALVGPLFITTIGIPFLFACKISRCADNTEIEVPAAITRSALSTAFEAVMTRSLGTESPKKTTSGFTIPPQSLHFGTLILE